MEKFFLKDRISKMVKMFGNLLEDKLSGVFGDMVHILHQTGMQTIYIASLC